MTDRNQPTTALPYWQSHGFRDQRETLISWAMFAGWLGLCLYGAAHHETWRDEMRALTMAIAPDHLWQLPAMLHNEGHPILWYLVLRLSYLLTGTTVVLKICGFVAGAAGLAIWWRRAPFTLWLKLLFLCSGMAVYSCVIMSRNYGIGLIFLFGFAAVYRTNQAPPWAKALLLALLMNCNASGFLLGGLLAAYWMIDWRLSVRPIQWRRLAPAGVILILGTILAVWIAKPDQSSNVSTGIERSAGQMVLDLVRFAVHPGPHYDQLLAGVPPWLCTVLLYGMLLILARRRLALIFGFVGLIGMTAFFGWIYPGHLRHEGMVLCYLLTLWWLCRSAEDDPVKWRTHLRPAGMIALALVLIIQAWLGFLLVRQDLRHPMSSAKALAGFLEEYPIFDDAVMICDPAYLVETIPYYRPDQRIYMPREGRFQQFSRFTQDAKSVLTLSEFLTPAKRIAADEQVPVLLLVGHPDMLREPAGTSDIGYVQSFTWTEAERQDFFDSVTHLRTFTGTITGEDYAVFVLSHR